MSTIRFVIREDGRSYWYRYATVELDTEDYDNIDDMRDAAMDLVADGDADYSDMEYTDKETDEREHTEDNYDEDDEEAYRWASDGDVKTVKTPEESSIEW